MAHYTTLAALLLSACATVPEATVPTPESPSPADSRPLGPDMQCVPLHNGEDIPIGELLTPHPSAEWSLELRADIAQHPDRQPYWGAENTDALYADHHLAQNVIHIAPHVVLFGTAMALLEEGRISTDDLQDQRITPLYNELLEYDEARVAIGQSQQRTPIHIRVHPDIPLETLRYVLSTAEASQRAPLCFQDGLYEEGQEPPTRLCLRVPTQREYRTALESREFPWGELTQTPEGFSWVSNSGESAPVPCLTSTCELPEPDALAALVSGESWVVLKRDASTGTAQDLIPVLDALAAASPGKSLMWSPGPTTRSSTLLDEPVDDVILGIIGGPSKRPTAEQGP